MIGGAGHIMDMNNRMKQNRSMKNSQKEKFKLHNKDLVFKGDTKKLEFKQVPEKELQRIKFEIRQRAKAERKREMLIFIAVLLLLAVLAYVFVVWKLRFFCY